MAKPNFIAYLSNPLLKLATRVSRASIVGVIRPLHSSSCPVPMAIYHQRSRPLAAISRA
jgi:hypothetical protein